MHPDRPFRELRLSAWLSIKRAAVLLELSERTIKRYDKYGAPRSVMIALSWMAGTAENWEGFRFDGAYLVVPSGDKIHRNVISNLPYYTYLQRSIGYTMKHQPGVAKNPRNFEIGDGLDISTGDFTTLKLHDLHGATKA